MQREVNLKPEQKLGQSRTRCIARRLAALRGPLLWSAAACGLAMSVSVAPALAQPQPNGAEMSAAAAQIVGEWAELKRQMGADEVTAPAKVIARYQQFFEARGFGSGAVSVEISSRVAQLYWRGLGQRAKAGEILKWAIVQYDGLPQAERLGRELALLEAQVEANEEKKPKAGENTLDADAEGTPEIAKVEMNVARKGASALAIPQMPSSLVVATPPGGLTMQGAGGPMAPIAPVGLMMAGAGGPMTSIASVTPFSAPVFGGARVGAIALPPTTRARQTVGGEGGLDVVALTALMRRLNEENLSREQVEVAWNESGLSAAQALEWLRGAQAFDRSKQGAASQLMGLVARHGSELVSAPYEWRESDQLLLAKYYTSARDERAEPIYLRLLEQIKGEELRKREVPALYGLHSYYLAMGRTEQAADTLLSASQYTIRPAVLGNAPVEAARLYKQVGANEKADAAYEQAKGAEFGWSVGLALYDQASALMEQNKHQAARELLKQPVKGKFADQIQVAMLALLSDSYFRTGESEAAREAGEQCLQQYEALVIPLEGEGLQELIRAVKQRLRTIAEGGVHYDERIIQRGEGQTTGEPLYDEAYALIKEGKHAEARVLLKKTVTGADAAVGQVRLLSLLSASYLKTGEVELAHSTARKALETHRGLKNSQINEGLEYQVERAKKVLDWSGRYQAGQRSTTKTQPQSTRHKPSRSRSAVKPWP